MKVGVLSVLREDYRYFTGAVVGTVDHDKEQEADVSVYPIVPPVAVSGMTMAEVEEIKKSGDFTPLTVLKKVAEEIKDAEVLIFKGNANLLTYFFFYPFYVHRSKIPYSLRNKAKEEISKLLPRVVFVSSVAFPEHLNLTGLDEIKPRKLAEKVKDVYAILSYLSEGRITVVKKKGVIHVRNSTIPETTPRFSLLLSLYEQIDSTVKQNQDGNGLKVLTLKGIKDAFSSNSSNGETRPQSDSVVQRTEEKATVQEKTTPTPESEESEEKRETPSKVGISQEVKEVIRKGVKVPDVTGKVEEKHEKPEPSDSTTTGSKIERIVSRISRSDRSSRSDRPERKTTDYELTDDRSSVPYSVVSYEFAKHFLMALSRFTETPIMKYLGFRSPLEEKLYPEVIKAVSVPFYDADYVLFNYYFFRRGRISTSFIRAHSPLDLKSLYRLFLREGKSLEEKALFLKEEISLRYYCSLYYGIKVIRETYNEVVERCNVFHLPVIIPSEDDLKETLKDPEVEDLTDACERTFTFDSRLGGQVILKRLTELFTDEPFNGKESFGLVNGRKNYWELLLKDALKDYSVKTQNAFRDFYELLKEKSKEEKYDEVRDELEKALSTISQRFYFYLSPDREFRSYHAVKG